MGTEDGAPGASRRSPSLAYALKLWAFAIVFAGLSWLEYRWSLSHGHYARVGTPHTWFSNLWPWAAIVLLVWRFIRVLVRWNRS